MDHYYKCQTILYTIFDQFYVGRFLEHQYFHYDFS